MSISFPSENKSPVSLLAGERHFSTSSPPLNAFLLSINERTCQPLTIWLLAPLLRGRRFDFSFSSYRFPSDSASWPFPLHGSWTPPSRRAGLSLRYVGLWRRRKSSGCEGMSHRSGDRRSRCGGLSERGEDLVEVWERRVWHGVGKLVLRVEGTGSS